MKILLFIAVFLSFLFSIKAQSAFSSFNKQNFYSINNPGFNNYTAQTFSKKKLFQRNHGMILGLQRGSSTSIEFGGEAHWRKLALKKPTVTGASLNTEYNFGNHVIGYKASMWTCAITM